MVLAWPLVCGSAVAKRAKGSSFQNGTLTVLVPDAGWQAQLEEFSNQYRDALSRLAGAEVLRIRYEIIKS